MTQRPSLALIGPGRVGCAIGKRLHDAGYRWRALVGRHQETLRDAAAFIGIDPQRATTDLSRTIEADVILLAVQDDAVIALAHELASLGLKKTTTLVHFSGLLPASVMDTDPGAPTLSIHPLLSFADRATALVQLEGCPCAIESENAACTALGHKLVDAIGGRGFILPATAKTLYHLAASVASNFQVTLAACARNLMTHCGFDQQQATELLRPLQQATAANLAHLSAEEALTGPIARGDVSTVAHHLLALATEVPDMLDLYRVLATHTLTLAQADQRLSAADAEALNTLLKQRPPDPQH